VRETFESAVLIGETALGLPGVEPEAAGEIMEAVRRRDADRFRIALAEGNGGTGLPICSPGERFGPRVARVVLPGIPIVHASAYIVHDAKPVNH
jgi:hypothetical protein